MQDINDIFENNLFDIDNKTFNYITFNDFIKKHEILCLDIIIDILKSIFKNIKFYISPLLSRFLYNISMCNSELKSNCLSEYEIEAIKKRLLVSEIPVKILTNYNFYITTNSFNNFILYFYDSTEIINFYIHKNIQSYYEYNYTIFNKELNRHVICENKDEFTKILTNYIYKIGKPMIHSILCIHYLYDKEPEYLKNNVYENKFKENKLKLEYLQNKIYENEIQINNLIKENNNLFEIINNLENMNNSVIKENNNLFAIINNLKNMNDDIIKENTNLIAIINNLENINKTENNEYIFINIYLCIVCIILEYFICIKF